MAAPAPVPLPEPLRLPKGTVRGLLAVFLALTYGYLLVRDDTVPTVLINAVVVAVAFYFGTGGTLATPISAGEPSAAARRRPRIIRGFLLLGFAGLAGWYLRANPSLSAVPADLLQVLQVLGGYVIGLSLSWLVHRGGWDTPGRRRLATAFRDVSAAGSLGLTVYICYAYVAGLTGTLAGQAENLLSLVITYYFGSRVVAR